MKKAILHFLLLLTGWASLAQTETAPPYKRFPTLPPLQLLMPDSLTIYTEKRIPKNRPVFIILFSPDCDHCQKETEELLENIESFKKIQIIMSTTLAFDKMIAFYKKNRLDQYTNIIVGQDRSFLLPTFYRISNLPYLAFYNKKGNLIDVFEGALPIRKVIEIFNKN